MTNARIATQPGGTTSPCQSLLAGGWYCPLARLPLCPSYSTVQTLVSGLNCDQANQNATNAPS